MPLFCFRGPCLFSDCPFSVFSVGTMLRFTGEPLCQQSVTSVWPFRDVFGSHLPRGWRDGSSLAENTGSHLHTWWLRFPLMRLPFPARLTAYVDFVGVKTFWIKPNCRAYMTWWGHLSRPKRAFLAAWANSASHSPSLRASTHCAQDLYPGLSGLWNAACWLCKGHARRRFALIDSCGPTGTVTSDISDFCSMMRTLCLW